MFRVLFLLFLLLALPVQAETTPHAMSGSLIGAAAMVNDDIISTVDMQDRIRLIIGTAGLENTPEIRKGILPQALRMLVDEVLQQQEAKRYSIRISDGEIDTAIANIERQGGKAPGSLSQMMAQRGLPKRSLTQQLRAQIGWSKIVLNKIRPKIRVSNEEVLQSQQRSAQGETREVRISSIQLSVDSPADEQNIRQLAYRLVNEIRQGKSFKAIAAQLNAGAADANRETGFWVKVTDLDPQISGPLMKTRIGDIIDPVRTASGYHIVKLYDTRVEEGSRPSNQTEVALKQILLTLVKEAADSEVNLMLNIARRISDDPGSCSESGVAGFQDIDMLEIKVDYMRSSMNHIPLRIRDLLQGIAVGEATEPFATPDGIQVMLLCERIEVPVELTVDERVRDRLLQEKLRLEALKYMRNMRREAFVDIRL